MIESDTNIEIQNYSIVKNVLSTIIINQNYQDIINDAVYRTSNIVSHTCNFLKLYVLYKYDNNQKIIINKQFISTIMTQVSTRKTKQGRTCKNEYISEIQTFYNNNYKQFITTDNICNNDLLCYILKYEEDNNKYNNKY